MIMKKILLVVLLGGFLFGLSQENVLADQIIINDVSFSGGRSYTGTIANDAANTLAVSFDLVTSLGGLQGFCVEGGETFNIPPPKTYNIIALTNDAQKQAAYIAQTYFAGGFNSLATGSLTLDDVEAAAQYAIWQLVQPTSLFAAPWTGLADTMLADAAKSGFNGVNWFILQNLGEPGQQDFIAKIPEPSTLLLIGLGLVGLAGLSRRRFKG
jgi:hypothetical protein